MSRTVLIVLIVLAGAFGGSTEPVPAQPAPCSATEYPECGGDCPEGEECIGDEDLEECRCVPTQDGCGDAQAPECDGACPDPVRQECVSMEDGCSCVERSDPPCESTTPEEECGGTCPEGLICEAEGVGEESTCRCVTDIPACGSPDDPECLGRCAEGTVCTPVPGGGCACEPDLPCGDASAEDCDGYCTGEGSRCVWDGEECVCLPIDVACGDAVAPECDGLCSDDSICAEDPAFGGCRCQPLECEQSPYPECGGSCPDGSVCRDDPITGTCTCDGGDLPCAEAAPPECGGACTADSVCRADSTGEFCECAPVGVSCSSALAPVCDGDCPEGESCEDAGGECVCVPHGECGDALAPECDGNCPQGLICSESILGACRCSPLLTDCGDTEFPVCDGACPDGHRCEGRADPDGCFCLECEQEGLIPGPDTTLLWADDRTLRWSGITCASSYNVYRVTEPFLDADGDGAAESYGDCLAGNLPSPSVTDPDRPDPGQRFGYLVTGVNSAGAEGSLGNASSGADRPNSASCP
jgi:hypothetical protein